MRCSALQRAGLQEGVEDAVECVAAALDQRGVGVEKRDDKLPRECGLALLLLRRARHAEADVAGVPFVRAGGEVPVANLSSATKTMQGAHRVLCERDEGAPVGVARLVPRLQAAELGDVDIGLDLHGPEA